MGIDNMHGDYFSWLSHDDLYHEDKIKKQIEQLSKLKDKTTLITCGFTRINENGREMSDFEAGVYTVESDKFTNKQLEIPLFALLRGGCIFGCSLLIHKSHFDRVGKFDSSMLTNDYDLWFRMMRKHKLIYIREPLAYKRLHDEQDTHTKSKYINAIWIGYFMHAVDNLSDEELNQVYGSRSAFYDYAKDNFEWSEEYLKQVLSAKTMDEKKYVILNNTIYKQYDEELKLLSQKHELDIQNLIRRHEEEIKKINQMIESYESSLSWKFTKPLRIFESLLGGKK